MHILFVTRNYDAPHMGGRNPSLRYIEKELRARGHDVTIVSTPSSTESLEQTWPENVHFTRFIFSYYLTAVMSPFALYRRILDIHRSRRVDIVHSCEREFAGMASLIFHKKYGIPFIQWAYDGGYVVQKSNLMLATKNPFKYAALVYMKYAEKKVFSECNYIATIGIDINRTLAKRFEKGKIRLIGNAVDTNMYRPLATGHSPFLKELSKMAKVDVRKKKVICFVGRINKLKGTGRFVEIAHMVNRMRKDCIFAVVGNDKDNFKKDCLNMQKRLGINNVYWFRERNDIVNVLNASYLLLMPIWPLSHGTGNILLEAMSCGTPVVNAKASAARYIIRNWENGCLFAPYDLKAAAKIVSKICDYPKIRDSMGKEARKTVLENHSIQRITDKLEHLYKKAMAVQLP